MSENLDRIDYDRVRKIIGPLQSEFDRLWGDSSEYTRLLFNIEWSKVIDKLERRNYILDIVHGRNLFKLNKESRSWVQYIFWLIYISTFVIFDDTHTRIFVSTIFVVFIINFYVGRYFKFSFETFVRVRSGIYEDEINFHKTNSRFGFPDYFDIPNPNHDENYIKCEKYYYRTRIDLLKECKRIMSKSHSD
jgi:hypothetical protein